MVFMALGVSARVVQLHLFDRDFLQEQGEKRVVRRDRIPADRGMILDRQGEPLAASSPVISLWINPAVFLRSSQSLIPLAKALDMPVAGLAERLQANSEKQFLYLQRHLSPHRAQAILDQRFPGVHGETEYRRYYPAGEITAQWVGFTNIDQQGQEGVERAYQSALQGQDGFKRVIKDLYGRTVKDIGLEKSAEPGENLTLSIDLRAQYVAYRELLTAVREFQADAGNVIALDVNTGEVIAAVNVPSFNPNRLIQEDLAFVRNRVLTDTFEPGSTLKPFTLAAALESGLWHAESVVDTAPGFFRIGRKRIRDNVSYGVIDLATVLAKSSNVGAAKIALSLEPDALSDMFARVGLGASPGTGFPGEATGSLPFRENWRPLDLAALSYGYGVSVSSLQLAQAYAVLGAGGIRRPVSLLKIVQPQSGQRVLSETIAKQVVGMLEKATQKGGTGTQAVVPGYRVAGKTGTVHKVGRNGYQDHHYLALFAGLAPVESPQIAMVVVLDNPKGEQYYGGQVAAPVFSRIMADLLRIKQVMPDLPAEQWVHLPITESNRG
jgi:cell division protein FtsI (penicillin-binding protein 3)